MITEVFSTNISSGEAVQNLQKSFHEAFPNATVFFDLEDCDKIMKVVASAEVFALIPEWLKKFGFDCAVLPE